MRKKTDLKLFVYLWQKDNVRELKKYCSKSFCCHPGEVNRIESILKEEEVKQLTFLGKVHKKFYFNYINLIKEL